MFIMHLICINMKVRILNFMYPVKLPFEAALLIEAAVGLEARRS